MSDVQPIPGLDDIKDPATKQALRALVDGWSLRNGATGDGGQRFVTAEELESGGVRIAASSIVGAGPTDNALGGSLGENIPALIAALSEEIFASRLWQDLGERVAHIDRPGLGQLDMLFESTENIKGRAERTESLLAATGRALAGVAWEYTAETTAETSFVSGIKEMLARVGSTEAGLKEEVKIRSNADTTILEKTEMQFAAVKDNLALVSQKTTTTSNDLAALTKSVGTWQSEMNKQQVLLQQSFETSAKAIGGLSAQYTVKIDNNGYVTGFGLASTSVDGVPKSEFYIRADRFAVGAPGNPKIVPFIIQDGNVYIDSALVRKLVGTEIRGARITGGDMRGAFIGGGVISQVNPITIVSHSDTAYTHGVEAVGAFTKRCYLYIKRNASKLVTDKIDDAFSWASTEIALLGHDRVSANATRLRGGTLDTVEIDSVLESVESVALKQTVPHAASILRLYADSSLILETAVSHMSAKVVATPYGLVTLERLYGYAPTPIFGGGTPTKPDTVLMGYRLRAKLDNVPYAGTASTFTVQVGHYVDNATGNYVPTLVTNTLQLSVSHDNNKD